MSTNRKITNEKGMKHHENTTSNSSLDLANNTSPTKSGSKTDSSNLCLSIKNLWPHRRCFSQRSDDILKHRRSESFVPEVRLWAKCAVV